LERALRTYAASGRLMMVGQRLWRDAGGLVAFLVGGPWLVGRISPLEKEQATPKKKVTNPTRTEPVAPPASRARIKFPIR
jgi:hypothetical protein